MLGHLAIKALLSGVLIALASEIARRNPGLGGLLASLPMVSTLAIIWMWNENGGDAAKVADFAMGNVLYVLASLPAYLVFVILLRRGAAFPLTMLIAALVCIAGYTLMGWIGSRLGWPV